MVPVHTNIEKQEKLRLSTISVPDGSLTINHSRQLYFLKFVYTNKNVSMNQIGMPIESRKL